MKVWQAIVMFVINGIIFDTMDKYAFKRCMRRGRKNGRCKNWQCKMCTQCEFSVYYGFEWRKKKHP